MPIGARYKLADAEARLAEYVARGRWQVRRDAGSVNARRNPAGDERTDLEGIAAEIAFCALHNVYPDLVITSAALPDHDAVLPGGVRVDVKSTEWPQGRLLVMPNKADRIEVDLYALMVGGFPGPYRFAGFMPREEMVITSRLWDAGYGEAYKAEQTELVSFAVWYCRKMGVDYDDAA